MGEEPEGQRGKFSRTCAVCKGQLLEHAALPTGLRRRIRNALAMLRDRYDGTGFTLDTAEEVEAMVEALRAASTVAFGSDARALGHDRASRGIG